MNREPISYYLKNPKKLIDVSVSQIEKWLSESPYSQPIRLLLAKKLQLNQEVVLNSALSSAATIASNRIWLYREIHDVSQNHYVNKGESSQSEVAIGTQIATGAAILSLAANTKTESTENIEQKEELITDNHNNQSGETDISTREEISSKASVSKNESTNIQQDTTLEKVSTIESTDTILNQPASAKIKEEAIELNSELGIDNEAQTEVIKNKIGISENHSQTEDVLTMSNDDGDVNESVDANSSNAKSIEESNDSEDTESINVNDDEVVLSENTIIDTDHNLTKSESLIPALNDNKSAKAKKAKKNKKNKKKRKSKSLNAKSTKGSEIRIDEADNGVPKKQTKSKETLAEFWEDRIGSATHKQDVVKSKKKSKKNKTEKKVKSPTKVVKTSKIDLSDISDYTKWLLSFSEGKENDSCNNMNIHNSVSDTSGVEHIINSAKKKKSVKQKEKSKKVKAKKKSKSKKQSKTDRSLESNEEIISELWADLLSKQGHIKKARKMYLKLSLKYPEKSTYFAGKLENLKKNK